MPGVILKASDHEPNFCFASAGDGEVENCEITPTSSEFNPDQSDVVLQKMQREFFDYRGTITKRVGSSNTDVPRSISGQVVDHVKHKWGVYATMAFGIFSICGCIAAGIALSSIQPFMIDETASSDSESWSQTSESERPVFIPILIKPVPTTTSTPLTSTLSQRKLFTTTQSQLTTKASTRSTFQEASLRTTMVTRSHSVTFPATRIRELPRTTRRPRRTRPPLVENQIDPPYQQEAANYAPVRNRFQYPSFTYRTSPPTVRTYLRIPDDMREPDRYPVATMIFNDPRTHKLNITFVKDDWAAGHTRSMFKRSPTAGPVINQRIKKFTAMRRIENEIIDASPSQLLMPWDPYLYASRSPFNVKIRKPACGSGFEWDDLKSGCIDVNECVELGFRACGENSECRNQPGTYTCRCAPGFRLDPVTLTCLDIDECKESNFECSQLAVCENRPGGYLCRCMDGFVGNGVMCEAAPGITPIIALPPAERIDPESSSRCQRIYPPQPQQIVSSLFFPEPLPSVSHSRLCVEKIECCGKVGITFVDFLPSMFTPHEFDFLRIGDKMFTTPEYQEQTLFVLEPKFDMLEVEFMTDSDILGNRFTLAVTQEPCPLVNDTNRTGCAEMLKVEGTSITSLTPHYVDNLYCTSALYPPDKTCGLQLTFLEFMLEGPSSACMFDYLDILGEKLCGNLKNQYRELIFPNGTAKVPIIFSTDSSFVGRGFNISFTWLEECF